MTTTAGTKEEAGLQDWTQGAASVLVSACRSCGTRWYLPHAACPSCGSDDTARLPSAGLGVIVAVTVIHRRASGGEPVGIALVDLDEGVRMMARCPTSVTVGDRIALGFVSAHPPADTPLVPSCQEAT